MEDTIEPKSGNPTSAEATPETVDIAFALAKVAQDGKAKDMAILDMSALVDYTDTFVLATGRNRRHVAALADEIRRFAKVELGMQALSVEGMTAGRWVLVDFGSVVIHIFDEPFRAFYNLDGLWGDAPKLAVPDPDPEDADDPDTAEDNGSTLS